jgi:hypothetical protein
MMDEKEIMIPVRILFQIQELTVKGEKVVEVGEHETHHHDITESYDLIGLEPDVVRYGLAL